jgi:hypothetical protein
MSLGDCFVVCGDNMLWWLGKDHSVYQRFPEGGWRPGHPENWLNLIVYDGSVVKPEDLSATAMRYYGAAAEGRDPAQEWREFSGTPGPRRRLRRRA